MISIHLLLDQQATTIQATDRLAQAAIQTCRTGSVRADRGRLRATRLTGRQRGELYRLAHLKLRHYPKLGGPWRTLDTRERHREAHC